MTDSGYRPRLKRIAAGVYETPDGQGRLIRTEWEGSHGGRRYLWEFATLDRLGWTVQGEITERTKREALIALGQAVVSGDRRGRDE